MKACPPFRGLMVAGYLAPCWGGCLSEQGPTPHCCSILSRESQTSRAYRFCLLTDKSPRLCGHHGTGQEARTSLNREGAGERVEADPKTLHSAHAKG